MHSEISQEMKICKCGNQYIRANKKVSLCKPCRRKATRLWKQRNRDKCAEYNKKARSVTPDERKAAYLKKFRDRVRNGDSGILSVLRILLRQAKCNGQSRGRAVNITANDLLELWHRQMMKCATSHMLMHADLNSLRSVSIDRIDNNGDYTIDNVQLVCRWVNYAKNKYGNSEIIDILNEYKFGPK